VDWEGVGLADEVTAWLDETGSRKATRERRLDPFATSMRDFDDVAANLESVEKANAVEHTDTTQRVADLRSAGLVETPVGAPLLSALGAAVLANWRAAGVANSDKLDEAIRTVIVYGTAREMGVEPYVSFLAYWAELRAAFDPAALIDGWDNLFTLNYLDHRIDDFAPGDAFRDEGIRVADIVYDLDIFVRERGASEQVRKGASQVRRGIEGKVPRGRARATCCLAMELLLRPPEARTALVARFGLPLRPHDWKRFAADRAATLLKVVARFDGLVTAVGAPAAKTIEVADKPDAPIEPYDFASALQAVPKRAKSKRVTGSGGPKKVDYVRKQERNSEVGQLGEAFALEYERWRLSKYPELVKNIVHVSLDDDTLGYDIKSFETDGRPRYVEVKATEGPLATRFFISANEIACAEQHAGDYLIMRVGNVRSRPVCCEIRDLGAELDFRAVTFECTFKPTAESPGEDGANPTSQI
jgi:hypothetical protein